MSWAGPLGSVTVAWDVGGSGVETASSSLQAAAEASTATVSSAASRVRCMGFSWSGQIACECKLCNWSSVFALLRIQDAEVAARGWVVLGAVSGLRRRVRWLRGVHRLGIGRYCDRACSMVRLNPIAQPLLARRLAFGEHHSGSRPHIWTGTHEWS